MCLLWCVCQGHVEAGTERCLRVLYLPGVPEVFEKQVQLKVAFLPLQDITLTGEGVFPRISLNLPQNLCMRRPAPLHTDMITFLPKDEHLQCNTGLLSITMLIPLAKITNGICNRLATILYWFCLSKCNYGVTGRTLCPVQWNGQFETQSNLVFSTNFNRKCWQCNVIVYWSSSGNCQRTVSATEQSCSQGT